MCKILRRGGKGLLSTLEKTDLEKEKALKLTTWPFLRWLIVTIVLGVCAYVHACVWVYAHTCIRLQSQARCCDRVSPSLAAISLLAQSTPPGPWTHRQYFPSLPYIASLSQVLGPFPVSSPPVHLQDQEDHSKQTLISSFFLEPGS